MLVTIIFEATILFVVAIMYYSIKKLAKYEAGSFYGVEMKKAWYEDPDNQSFFEEIKKKYNRQMAVVIIAIVILSIIPIFIPYVSIQIFIWLLVTFASIFAIVIPQYKANKALKKFKTIKGYYAEEATERFAELKADDMGRRISFKAFVAPFAISLLSAVIPLYALVSGRNVIPASIYSFWIVLASSLLIILIMYGIAVWMSKKMTLVICEDSNINVNYSRAKKKNAVGFCKDTSWVTGIFTLVMAASIWFPEQSTLIIILASVLYTIILIVLCIGVIKREGKIADIYKEHFKEKFSINDDKYWIGGFIYYNPHDRRLTVPTRMGFGLTTNLAKPVAKIMDLVGLIVILGTVLMCVWIIRLEFTPINIRMNGDAVEAYQTKVKYSINKADMQEITLIDSLPAMVKSSGNAMDNQYTGKFWIRDEGRNCNVFLNPQNSIFIRIVTGDSVYYLSGSTDEITKDIYESIK